MTVHRIIPGAFVPTAGGVLMIPPSTQPDGVAVGIGGIPDVYAESTTQLFPLGTKFETADGRVFRYGRIAASDTTVPLARMVVNGAVCPGATGHPNSFGYEGTCNAAAVGDTYVDLNDTNNQVANYYEDGMLACYPSGHYCCYRIIGSDVYDHHAANHIRVYLEVPLKTALVADSTGVTAYQSKWYNVTATADTGHSTFETAIGVYLGATFTASSFGWFQTRGLAIITPTAYFGDTANERMAQLHTDGTIALKAADGTQTVGVLSAATESGYGDLLVQLWLE